MKNEIKKTESKFINYYICNFWAKHGQKNSRLLWTQRGERCSLKIAVVKSESF